MTSSMNETVDVNVADSPEKTYYVEILSISYGLLLVVVLGHLVFRWQWRRRTVSQLHTHYPADKTFKCKAIRQRLKEDFAAIRKLSPDPKLINENFEPAMFGPCFNTNGEAVPSHWYRMQTCEAAAAFVMANEDQVEHTIAAPGDHTYFHRPSGVEALPDFLSKLQGKGLLRVGGAEVEELVVRSCDLYTMARFKDGEFSKDFLMEFRNCVENLQTQLNSALVGGGGTGVDHSFSLASDPNTSFLSSNPQSWGGQSNVSMEPLLTDSQHSSWKSFPLTTAKASHIQPDLSPLLLQESARSPDFSNTEPVIPLQCDLSPC